MKRLLTLIFTLSSSAFAEVSNPAIPGTVYTGTNDEEVFKMLIFSCFENCNSKYYESMHVPKLQKKNVPPNATIPFIIKPSGRAISHIRIQKVELNKNYTYPQINDDTKLIQYMIEMEKSEDFNLTLNPLVGMIDGKYYILRPYYLKN